MRLGSPRGNLLVQEHAADSSRMTASPVRVEINLSTIFDRLFQAGPPQVKIRRGRKAKAKEAVE
jgi:hypothetical protein